MNTMRKGSFGGGLDVMLLRSRGVVGRGRSVQELSALGILGCVTLCDKDILGTNWDKLSVVKLQLQLSLNKKYQDSRIISRQYLPLSREHPPSPKMVSWVIFSESLFKQRTVKSRLWLLGHWLEGELHPTSGNALLVGTKGEGVTSIQSGQFLVCSGLACRDRQGQD